MEEAAPVERRRTGVIAVAGPGPVTDRRALVDLLIDHGLRLSPATDWSLVLPPEWLASIPVEGDRLLRPVDTRRSGYLRAPVYRGLELVPQPLTRPVLILSDTSGLRATLFMNADTGQIGQDVAQIGLDDDAPDPEA